MKKNLTQMYMDQSIAAGTLRTYDIRINALKKFLSEKKKKNLTLELFAEFLALLETRNGHASKSTAEGYRAALVHFQRVHNLWTTGGTWADSWHCRKVVAGYAYKGKTTPATTRPTRGQVDTPMFAQMMKVAAIKHKRFAPALELAYRIALRPHQLMALKQGSYDGSHITIPDKRARATNRFSLHTRKEVIDPLAHALLQQYETHPGAYFKFSLTELRSVFKKIGQELQWDTATLKFDGPHCLRHGGMRHGRDLLEGSTEEEIQAALQVTKNTLQRYTRPNSNRQ